MHPIKIIIESEEGSDSIEFINYPSNNVNITKGLLYSYKVIENGKISVGVIVGIVIGCMLVIAIVIICFLLIIVLRRKPVENYIYNWKSQKEKWMNE